MPRPPASAPMLRSSAMSIVCWAALQFTAQPALATEPPAAATDAVPPMKTGPRAKVLETKTILPAGQPYAGWSTVARRRDGTLWLVWSGGREAHICPFGQVHAMTSADDGERWTWPRVLLDSTIDDRDSGVIETARGTLLVTTFTSLAYEAPLAKFAVDDSRRARWLGVHDRLDAEGRTAELGEWLLRSTDGGTTWSARLPTLVNSPHGPIQLADGRLLYAGKELWTPEGRIGVCESNDDGLTWQWLAEIPARPGDTVKRGYHELHAVETADGRILVQIRNHNDQHKGETLQSESSDGGRTWSEPRSIRVWGLPSHLLKLRDGRLLMTYGYRRVPFGNQARVSHDHGRTWSEPLTVSADGASGDLGYPSTVERADGRLLTVWYEKPATGTATLRQAVWEIVE
jgi:sialidase-1